MSQKTTPGRPRLAALLGVGLVALVGLAVSIYGFFNLTGSIQPQGGTRLADPPLIEDVPLLAGDGGSRQLSDWQGQYRLVFFGYTSCPDVCPITMARLGQLYRDLGEPDGLQVLMVSVDPERDTPERLRAYVGNFHPSFVGLTGTPSTISRVVKQFYVAARELGDGTVAHTSSLMLLDPRGRFTAVYGEDDFGALETDLRRLL